MALRGAAPTSRLFATAGDRGAAVRAMAAGAAVIAQRLHARAARRDRRLGGSGGTTLATAAMRALPFGVPKLMVIDGRER